MENSNPQQHHNDIGQKRRSKRNSSEMGRGKTEGQKRRRKPGPASRALKQYYQSKQFVPSPFRRPPAVKTRNSTSFEHKYNDDDDVESTVLKTTTSTSFEFKQSDQDLVTPRLPDSSSLNGRNSVLDVALSCNIHAPLKKTRRPRYDEEQDDSDPPDTARIDLSMETTR